MLERLLCGASVVVKTTLIPSFSALFTSGVTTFGISWSDDHGPDFAFQKFGDFFFFVFAQAWCGFMDEVDARGCWLWQLRL